jgi:ATP-dependent DNA ligase
MEDETRYSASFTENIDLLLNRVLELSLEGLIGKRAGSKYDSKRSGAWIKIKLYQQGSFVIGGYTRPGNGNTWVPCWSASMKTDSSNLQAESARDSAKNS